MSIVAWDGKSIAADKQGTAAGLRMTTTKLKRLSAGVVLAWTQNQGSGLLMAKWYMDGADIAKYPDCQRDKEDWAQLIVATPNGVSVYERQPVTYQVLDSFMAWGSGRDYALGAMARGATAAEAVEVASTFDNGCGCGIDVEAFG